MSWAFKPITIKDRLSRLENELDELINLQELSRNQSRVNIGFSHEGNAKKSACINVKSHSRTQDNNHMTCSSSESTPLTDISKFLQHINFNISKGTQAITKIVNLSAQQKSDGENSSRQYHETGLQKNNTFLAIPAKSSFTKPSIEDDLFKEIREEKEKRQRAENQVRCLKEEIKISRSELQKKSDIILLLQSELKQSEKHLNEAKNQFQTLYQDHQVSERLWPFQFQALTKELEDERIKRDKAERTVQSLQEKLKTESNLREEHFKIKTSVDWLQNQNQYLTCLIEKLQNDIKSKKIEILNKNQTLEDNLRKLRQMTFVCEKLRNHLVVMKDKTEVAEDKLKNSLIHCQTLTDTLLKEQAKSEDLQKRLILERDEQQKVLENNKTITVSYERLQMKFDEVSEVTKQQKDAIDRQYEKLCSKEEQLRLAYENIKLLNEREKVFESKIKSPCCEESEIQKSLVKNNLNKIQLELKNEQEKLLIQEKIIDSHLQTAVKLKTTLAEKENEIHNLKQNISEKEQKIAITQHTNDQLMAKIKFLQSSKQEMRQKIEDLEEELEAQDSLEQAKRLDVIEKQIMEKQNKLEEENALIRQEREEIVRKLMCTIQKLENEIDSLKEDITAREHTIKHLNDQLSSKEQHLNEAFEKISLLSHELNETSERATKAEDIYKEKMKNAFDAWQKTMQILQS